MQDGFAEESTIFGGYNQFSANEQGGGVLRLLDNFTLYVQTDDEGSEELVDLQDFTFGEQILLFSILLAPDSRVWTLYMLFQTMLCL